MSENASPVFAAELKLCCPQLVTLAASNPLRVQKRTQLHRSYFSPCLGVNHTHESAERNTLFCQTDAGGQRLGDSSVCFDSLLSELHTQPISALVACSTVSSRRMRRHGSLPSFWSGALNFRLRRTRKRPNHSLNPFSAPLSGNSPPPSRSPQPRVGLKLYERTDLRERMSNRDAQQKE